MAALQSLISSSKSVKIMSKKIVFELPWSEALALKASKLYYDYDMRHSAKRYIGWLFVALVQFGIVGALKHDSYALLYLSTFLVVYWYYGRWYLRKGMIKRFYRQHHNESEHLEVVVDAIGISINGAQIRWEEVLKVLVLEEGFVVQTQKGTLFFENSYFRKGNDKTTFKSLAKKEEKL